MSGHLLETSYPLFHRLHVKNSPLSLTLWWVLKLQTSSSVWALSGDMGSKEICGFMLFLFFQVTAASCPAKLQHELLSTPSHLGLGALGEIWRWPVIQRAHKHNRFWMKEDARVAKALSRLQHPSRWHQQSAYYYITMQLDLHLWHCWLSIISTLCKEHGFGAVSPELMSQISNESLSRVYIGTRWVQATDQLPGTWIKEKKITWLTLSVIWSEKNQRVSQRMGNSVCSHGFAQCTPSSDFQNWIPEELLTWG
jgi:hypothetical protein